MLQSIGKSVICALISVSLIAPLAGALPIGDVVVGARYSVTGIGPNRMVVYDDTQRTEWINPNRLLQSETDSFVNDTGEALVWTALAL
jgi:uncharacterized protein (UPF0218 family)